jgi:GcrA cell cycle regulator
MNEMVKAAAEGAMTYAALAESLKLSLNSVTLRSYALGYHKLKLQWPQEKIDVLRAKWPDHSAREIAMMIGKTRNSVIGKARRLGLGKKENNGPGANLVNKPPRPKRPENKEKNKRVRSQKPKPPTPVVEGKPIGNSTPIGIMKLRSNTCRAPVGYDRKGLTTYCGCETFSGKPFCPTHCRLFYVQGVA